MYESAADVKPDSQVVAAGGGNGFGQLAPNLPKPTRHKATLPGTNYCGPEGNGVPTNSLDWACAAHDRCYEQNGFTGGSNFNYFMSPQREATLQGCNQALCDSAAANPNDWGDYIQMYFKSVPVGPCHH
jgi:hypothetical protein